MHPSDVSAVIVTRGDVDLEPVLSSLIFEDVVVWNNGERDCDEMTHARLLATFAAENRIIYSQDDDIVHTREDQQRIIDSYQSGVLTGCMWPEWSDGARRQGILNGYDDLVFPGSGSVYDEQLAFDCADMYLEHYPLDDFYRLWSDTIFGILAPTQQLDIRFGELPHADNDNRMSHLPNAVALKTEAIMRARRVRDMVTA